MGVVHDFHVLYFPMQQRAFRAHETETDILGGEGIAVVEFQAGPQRKGINALVFADGP